MERKQVTVQGTTYYLDVVNGEQVMVEVVPEVCPDPWNRTSTDHPRYVSGKGRRNRYHRSGSVPVERNAWRFTTRD